MGKLTSILCCLISISTAIAAPGNPPAARPAVPANAAKPADPAIQPSRYAGEDPDAYAAELAKRLAIANRETDAFCQPQDPDAKPVTKIVSAKTKPRTTTAEPQAPLSDIVSQIKVTTIMPKDKRFFVNDRSFGVGDKIPLNYRNKTIRTQITEVSSSRIVFRNTESGEVGVLKLNLLPAGMTRGTKGITAPGMTPADPNAPLEIDSPSTQSVGPVTP
ncbi:MAG: hypothetical protein J0M04_21965 [Verrucomicrobia bacterium]|nr:hypothetical protein [Verrucomicrobiota bacterium]